MDTSTTDYRNRIRNFHDKVYEEADRTMHRFIIGYFILGVLLSQFHDTWTIGLGIGGSFFVIYFITYAFINHKPTLRYLISFLLWNYPLQFILQMHGMYELFFFYFISLTALLFYENWKFIIPTTIYSLLTVCLIYYFQETGFESIYLSEAQAYNISTLLIHIALVVFYARLCIVWSTVQAKQTEDSAINQVEMEEKLFHMNANIKFAEDISDGNLNADYSLDGTDDLGNSLMNMRTSLVDAADREEKEKFINVGLATIGEILRNNINDLTQLCDQVISELVTYMQANQGGVFIIKEGEHEKDTHLELIASRAFERKKYQEKIISIGQGLVGQAFLERESILLNDIPENYVNITSGMGASNPRSIMIVPLKSNEDIVGVIELASFTKFTEGDVHFLEKIGESIASTVLSTKVNEKTVKLLEDSEVMTEQMQAQEEEMRQNMEELQATQEEMDRTQKELKEKESRLNALINNTKDSILAIDTNYRVIVVNDAVKARYKGTQYERMNEGTNILETLGAVRDQWKGYYDRSLNGEKMNFIIKSSVDSESCYREYFIYPIQNASNQINGCSIFSREVLDHIDESKILKG